MFEKEEEDILPKSNLKLKKINPLRDFHIVCNEDDIKIVKGKSIEVPVKYIENLKTEKVIK